MRAPALTYAGEILPEIIGIALFLVPPLSPGFPNQCTVKKVLTKYETSVINFNSLLVKNR